MLEADIYHPSIEIGNLVSPKEPSRVVQEIKESFTGELVPLTLAHWRGIVDGIINESQAHPPEQVEGITINNDNEGVIFEAKFSEETKGESLGLATEREEQEDQEDQALVILETPTDQVAMDKAIEAIEARNGHIVHVFPPHILIGSLPKGEEANLEGQNGIASIHRDLVDASIVADYDQLAQPAVEAWNTMLISQQTQPADLAVEQVEVKSLTNDALEPPDLPKEIRAAGVDTAPDYYYQTSEYMIGDVAVGILCPESDGSIDPSTEDWTSQERQQVLNEIVAAMNWWTAREPRAHLTFYYDDHFTSPLSTGYEPITRTPDDQGLWVGQAMEALGYTASSYMTRVRDYDNDLRNRYGTDWAFTIFVVDSSNDADGCFRKYNPSDPEEQARFAYAFLGGPFMVMTYGNDGYDPNNMDAVTAHEMGHIFRALDQYCNSSTHMYCILRSGYLQVENQNSRAVSSSACGNCLTNEQSIMRGMIYPYTIGAVDYYARGQIGWWDLDQDNILDPRDPEVKETHLYSYIPNPINNPTGNITYRGLAVSKPHTVASVQWRIDGGPWTSTGVTAIDDVFDEAVEPFSFTLDASGIARGCHLFEVLLIDTNGDTQTAFFGSDELTVLRIAGYLPIIIKNYP